MSLKIYDTTLRDGAQRHGISLSVSDKIGITRILDDLGVPYIEGGWPGSNPKDMEYFRRVAGTGLKSATVAAFGSTRRPGAAIEADGGMKALLSAETPVVTIVGKSSEFQVTEVLETSLDENLRMISDTVSYLADRDVDVIFDAEHLFDGFRANPGYALETLKAARDAGAGTIVLCDTNGGTLPLDLLGIISAIKKEIDVPLGIHAHNDSGMAAANSIIAAGAGLHHVQGTINGYGERCGNADLCTVIPVLQLKMGIECIPPDRLGDLTKASRLVAEIANLGPRSCQPFVGTSAFAHKGGLHASAVSRNSRAYEHIDPGEVGNVRRVLVSELAGRGNILSKAGENGITLGKDDPRTEGLVARIKELEFEGYQFEGADGSFELLVRRALHAHTDLFGLEGFRVIVEKREDGPVISEATIKVRVGDRQVHTAAEGNGPVNALDNALRKALEGIYPDVERVKLADYKVRVIDGQDGTGARVRVLIESGDDERKWGTVGVSQNIIEASWLALVDSIEYGLLPAGRQEA